MRDGRPVGRDRFEGMTALGIVYCGGVLVGGCLATKRLRVQRLHLYRFCSHDMNLSIEPLIQARQLSPVGLPNDLCCWWCCCYGYCFLLVFNFFRAVEYRDPAPDMVDLLARADWF